MEIIEFNVGSAWYSQSLRLRHEILRKPLGLDLLTNPPTGEDANRHFGVVWDGQLVATVMAVPLPGAIMHIRQMAVREDCQGIGLGRQLMSALEDRLFQDGVHRLILHARITAIGFYERLGYRATGDPFQEVGIPHQRMEKP